MTTIQATLVNDEAPRTTLGESPRWDGHAWWWVDAAVGRVWRRVPGESAELVADRGGRVSLVHPVRGTDAQILDNTTLAPLSGDRGRLVVDPPTLLNDGTADAAGRLWVGTVDAERRSGAGALLVVEAGQPTRTVREGFTLSNGMAWDTSGTVLWHADSADRIVWAHQVELATGTVIDSRVAIELTEGMPDGLASDAEGGLWVAVYGLGQVHRYVDGRLDLVVEVPTPQTTAVELGGLDCRELLITTAREGYDEARSAAEPLAGRLFRAVSPVSGLLRPRLSPL